MVEAAALAVEEIGVRPLQVAVQDRLEAPEPRLRPVSPRAAKTAFMRMCGPARIVQMTGAR